MSVELKSEGGGDFQFNNFGWRCIVALAESNGFDDSKCGQPEEGVFVIPAESATSLADSVERSFIGADDTQIAQGIGRRLTELLVEPSASPMFPNGPIPFNERGVKHWREFIGFARRGGFTVRF